MNTNQIEAGLLQAYQEANPSDPIHFGDAAAERKYRPRITFDRTGEFFEIKSRGFGSGEMGFQEFRIDDQKPHSEKRRIRRFSRVIAPEARERAKDLTGEFFESFPNDFQVRKVYREDASWSYEIARTFTGSYPAAVYVIFAEREPKGTFTIREWHDSQAWSQVFEAGLTKNAAEDLSRNLLGAYILRNSPSFHVKRKEKRGELLLEIQGRNTFELISRAYQIRITLENGGDHDNKE